MSSSPTSPPAVAANINNNGNFNSSNPTADLFDARPSNKIDSNIAGEGDGDTWQEQLAVCEEGTQNSAGHKKKNKKKSKNGETGKLLIRSYYQNSRTGKRVWDEPPSGASNIVMATDEMRRMAQLQLNELHVVTGQVPDDIAEAATGSPAGGGADGQQDSGKKKKKKGFFGFGKSKKDKDQKQTDAKIRYRPGSQFLVGSKKKGGGKSQRGVGEDQALQEAIARSLAEAQGIPYDPHLPPPPDHTSTEEEELQMAKALSLSQQDASPTPVSATAAQNQAVESEEQLLARVLEESKLDSGKKKKKKKGGAAAAAATTTSPYAAAAPAGGIGVFDNLQMFDESESHTEDDRQFPAAIASNNLKKPPPQQQQQQQPISSSSPYNNSQNRSPMSAAPMPPTPTASSSFDTINTPPNNQQYNYLTPAPAYPAPAKPTTTATGAAAAGAGGFPTYVPGSTTANIPPSMLKKPPPQSTNVAAMFDPYGPSSSSSTTNQAAAATTGLSVADKWGDVGTTSSSSTTKNDGSLRKMEPGEMSPRRTPFGGTRSGSTKKMKDKAGLV